MEKEFTYSFLRQEMDNLVNRQDTYFSIAYASVAALWTAAVSAPSEWVSLIAIVLVITFSMKICDIWNGFIFISMYIKVYLETDGTNDWERMRAKYYERHRFSVKRKIIRKCLKYSFPLLNVISCILFWALRGLSFELIIYSWDNVLLLVIQLIVCLFHLFFWIKNYDADSVISAIEENWMALKSELPDDGKQTTIKFKRFKGKRMKNYPLYEHKQIYTLKEMLDLCAKEYGEKTAFAYPRKKQDISVSFKEFKQQVEALGTYFFNQRLDGCHVAVFGENSYEWILTHFAVTCGGNVIVPIDKELETESVAELLIDSESKVLVYSDTYSDIAEELRAKIPNITYLNMKNISSCVEQGEKLITEGNLEFINKEICEDSLATIVYTSGTTGKSKGVMLTHNNLMSNLYAASCNVKLDGTSILLLPLHHTFGLVAGLYAVMYYGYTLYINKSLKRVVDDLKKAKPQNTFAVPLIVETLYKGIWNTANKQGKDRLLRVLINISNALRKCKIDLRRLLFKSVLSAFGGNLEIIICGGAPLNPELVTGLDAFGIKLINGYGITECAPIVAVNRNKFNVVGSVGLPICCNEVKIAADGEILVKGDNVMLGYYHNEEETKKVFVGDWFKTGDIGFIDNYGALHITGRIKNLIILGNGENIPAESIEEQIYTISYVKEAICYGKDNLIVAEVYLDEEVIDAKDKINNDIQTLNQRLPQTRNIGRVVIRDTEFPKTTTKKIKRNKGGWHNA